MKRLYILLFLLTPLWHKLSAQDIFLAHWRPGILYNHRFSDRLSGSMNIDLEANWLRKREDQNSSIAFRPDHLNLQWGIAYQLTADLNLSGGYRFSLRNLSRENTDHEHRFLQQLSLTNRWNKFRFQGRLRTEQRLFRSINFRAIHRLRTRLSTDFPLQGEQLDAGEPYLNTNIEWVLNLSVDRPLFFRDTRTYGGIGWRLANGQRLENGLELRISRINQQNDRRRQLFWRLTWIL